ncbi:MAG: YihY/virulence factor BrkB family protein [Bacteroidales bacterium]|nr:YihY/virulence factor BrkB family protein [Bacteroidales bacterium]MBN2757284.1 YihY/virulence factor BrkB family protein [Bacteroidales bacterium]
MKTTLKNFIGFFKNRIWEIDTNNSNVFVKYTVNLYKVIILSIKGYNEDKIPMRASALTYFSLLSIVPVLAVAFAISKGFGLESLLEEQIQEALMAQKEVTVYLLDFSKSMLNSTKGGILAVISVVFLFYTVIRLFQQIENSFNIIWKIAKSRSFIRKFTDYLAIVLIAPVLIIVSGTANVYITTILRDFLNDTESFKIFTPFLVFSIKLLPYVVIWLLFTLVFIILPNKKVKFSHAFIAGLIAGTVYQLIQFYYINLQIGFSRYNTIYGSFAALPLFLIWMQLSWLVVLFGAEIATAIENLNLYGHKKEYNLLSISKKRILNLLILKKIVDDFKNEEKPPTIEELSKEMKIPINYVNHITNELNEISIISKIMDDKKGICFHPAKDIANLNLAEVILKMNQLGDNNLMVYQDIDFESITRTTEEFEKLIDINYSKRLIKDL